MNILILYTVIAYVSIIVSGMILAYIINKKIIERLITMGTIIIWEIVVLIVLYAWYVIYVANRDWMRAIYKKIANKLKISNKL